MKKLLFTFIMVSAFFITSFADSPITSTNFHKAYLDVAIVKYAKEIKSIDDKVRKNKDLKMDMKAEAAEIIFNYTDLYKDSC